MKFKILLVTLGLAAMVVMLIVACEDQPTSNLENDPNPTGLSPASITSLSPNEGYLKDVIIITGQGFNSTPALNFVAFGTKTAVVISSSNTQLEVIAPNIAGETVNVKVAVKGSELWSNEAEFTFFETLEVIDEEIVWPNGVAVDNSDNVYIGSASDGIIYKISPDGSKSEFAYVDVNGAMEFGPENYLYVCEKGEGKIVRISPDGGTVEDVVKVDEPIDFDWDSNQDMYIVSNWIEAEEMGGIFQYNTSGTLTQLVTLGSPKCVRIFEENLYISNIWDGQILKYDITSAGLENEEIIYEGDSPLGLEFDVDGTMYFTEAWETSLYTIKADGTEEVIYEEQLMTPMHYLTFYNKTMYIVYPGWSDVGMTMSAYIGVDQAPNYGRP